MVKRSTAILLSALLLAPAAATGYIPTAMQVFEEVVGNYSKLEDLSFKIEQITYDPKRGVEISGVEGEGSFLAPNNFRREFSLITGREVEIIAGGKYAKLLDDKLIEKSENKMPIELFFLGRPASRVVKYLSELKINKDVGGFGRVDDRIAWILGAEGEDAEGSQVWIDKKMGLPLRMIYPISDKEMMRIEYREWEKAIGKYPFPSRIFFYQNDDLVQEWRISDVKVNTGLKSSLFSVEKYFKPADSETAKKDDKPPAAQ